MLIRSDIQRSIGAMTIGLHQQIKRREKLKAHYGLREREQQAQFLYSGTCGTLPAEGLITIPFNVIFVGDPGMQRDSQLDRPIIRIAHDVLHGPAGMIPYAYVSSWQTDVNYNYTGVVINAGVHLPALSVAGATVPSDLTYKILLHVAVQGWCCLVDADGPLDAGGIQDDGS